MTTVRPTEKGTAHAPHHRARPRRLRRVLELGPGHRSPARRRTSGDRRRPTRCAGSPPTPPASATTSARSTGRSCSSPTPTAAPSSPTSIPMPARSSGSSTSPPSPRSLATAASSCRPSSPAARSATRCRPIPRSDGTTDLTIVQERFHEQFCATSPRRRRHGWPPRSGRSPRRRSSSRPATARCGRSCRRGSSSARRTATSPRRSSTTWPSAPTRTARSRSRARRTRSPSPTPARPPA